MRASEPGTVGIVGDGSLSDAVETAGAEPVVGSAETVLAAGTDWTLAVGDEALTDLVREGATGPVLAVAAAPGVPSVRRDAVGDAVEAVAAGDVPVTTRRVVAARLDGEPATRLLRDAVLVTDEPARISEYAVRTGDHRVDRFRSDGVAVATPAGSPGYTGDAGGPVLEPGSGTLAVVPIAPFRTVAEHWVLDESDVSLEPHREEPVVLVADGREWGRVPPETPVELVPEDELALLAPSGDWKNSNGRRSE